MFLYLFLWIGYRETNETYGMLVIEVNIPEQFLGCLQDMLHLTEHLTVSIAPWHVWMTLPSGRQTYVLRNLP